MLILCAFLCACTGKTEFSDSFICGEAEAYAVCEEGLLTASAGSVKCFDGAGEQTLDRELEVKPARIAKNGPIAAAYARGGTSIVFPDSGVIETDNGTRDSAALRRRIPCRVHTAARLYGQRDGLLTRA